MTHSVMLCFLLLGLLVLVQLVLQVRVQLVVQVEVELLIQVEVQLTLVDVRGGSREDKGPSWTHNWTSSHSPNIGMPCTF